MGKLHELLAVEGDLRAQAQRDVSQVRSLFTEGISRFVGQIRRYQPIEEGGEVFADEIIVLSTTTQDELSKVQNSFGRWIDAAVQKESTNRETSADIIINEKTLIKDLPATALLNLESKLAELRLVYKDIPTNDPAERWEWDEQLECYVAKSRITYRTKKVPKSFVAHEATKEHPAQVEVFSEDIRVGTWTTVIHSGMMTPSEKRQLLERIDALIRAVKQARQRANNIDTVDISVVDKLFAYIHGE